MTKFLFSFLAISLLVNTITAQVPTVTLRDSDCGILDYTTNDIIKATQPANTSSTVYYQWRFEELEAPFTTYELVSPNGSNPNFRLKWFTQIEYGKTYDVSVRLATNPGPMVGSYGPSCIIGLQDNVISTKLEDQYANTFISFCDVIGAEAVGAADQYRWTFDDFQNPQLTVFGDDDQRLLRVSKVPNLRLGKTYLVAVYATVNGAESPTSTFRFLNTNNFVPNTGLNQNFHPCGGTYPINTQVQAVEVCRAENYTWRFQNTSQPQADLIYTRVGGNRFIRLEWVTGLIPGDNYNVSVKARQGFKNGDYSAICNITIGASTAPGLWNPYAEDNPLFITGTETPNGVIDMAVYSKSGGSDNNLVIDVANGNEGEMVQLQLYDLNGRLVDERKEQVSTDGSTINWLVGSVSPGIYILRATNGSDIVSKKILLF